MTERLEFLIEELVLLARENPARSVPGISDANALPTLYSWESLSRNQAPSSELSLVRRAVGSRLVRLWLDTFYETDLAHLYVTPINRYPSSLRRIALNRLVQDWHYLSRIDTPATHAIRAPLIAWRKDRNATTIFLAQTAEFVDHFCTGALTHVVASYAQAIAGRWQAAASIAKRASSSSQAGQAVVMRLMAANLQLITGNVDKCLSCLTQEDRQSNSFSPQALKLLVAAKTANRSMIAEASYKLEDLGPEYEEQIVGSIERRNKRISKGLQLPPPRYKDAPAFRGLTVGENSKRLLMW